MLLTHYVTIIVRINWRCESETCVSSL